MWWAALFSGKNGTLIRNITIGSIILTIIVVLIFVFIGINRKNKRIASNREKIQKYEDEIIDDNVSFSDSEFLNLANKIDNAMGNWFEDDNEQAVYSVFMQMKTNSDVLKLQSVFGTRHGKLLFDYIRDHFNNEEIQKINDILTQRNISINI